MIFASAIVTACLAQSPVVYPLNIWVEPATVVRGRPIRLRATVTYRGAESITVNAFRLSEPCWYWVPAAWEPIPGAERKQYAVIGSITGGMWPGRPLNHVIDLTATHRTADLPPGRYMVRVQAVVSQVSFPPLVEVAELRSRSVDVAVTIVDPRVAEVKTEIGR